MTKIINSSILVVIAAIFHMSIAVPNIRIKRDDSLVGVEEINPVEISEVFKLMVLMVN